MNQVTFRSESTSGMRELAIAVRTWLRAAMLAVKSFAAELIIIGVMAVAVMALKLVHIAVSNPAVADALVSGSLFF